MMRIPLFPVALNFRMLLRLLGGAWYRGREEFTSALALFFDIPPDRIFLFAAGRMALYSFLQAAGVGEGDEVVLPGYTCTVVPSAVKYIGAKAVYADLEEGCVNPSFERIRSVVTPRTKAIVVPHNFGIPFTAIPTLKKEFPGILVVEDAAHALGSTTERGLVGLDGDASFFSLEFSKPITAGMGGVLIVNRADLIPPLQTLTQGMPLRPRIDRLRILLTLLFHCLSPYPPFSWFCHPLWVLLRRFRLIYQTGPLELSGEKPSPYPAALSPLFAFLASQQMRLYPSFAVQHKRIQAVYEDLFKGLATVCSFDTSGAVCVRYPLCVADPERLERVKSILSRLTGFQIGRWFNDVVHPAGSFSHGYMFGVCPEGESLASRILNLPVTIRMTDRELGMIIENKEEIRNALENA